MVLLKFHVFKCIYKYFFLRKPFKKITAAILSIQFDTKDGRCEIHGTTYVQLNTRFVLRCNFRDESTRYHKCECSVLILEHKY